MRSKIAPKVLQFYHTNTSKKQTRASVAPLPSFQQPIFAKEEKKYKKRTSAKRNNIKGKDKKSTHRHRRIKKSEAKGNKIKAKKYNAHENGDKRMTNRLGSKKGNRPQTGYSIAISTYTGEADWCPRFDSVRKLSGWQPDHEAEDAPVQLRTLFLALPRASAVRLVPLGAATAGSAALRGVLSETAGATFEGDLTRRQD